MKNRIYIGLSLVVCATLMLEILLTRIFSVTMYYHFAFLAVSVAMFGTTVGALIVFLFPKNFPQDKVQDRVTQSAVFFVVFMVISLMIILQIPSSFDDIFRSAAFYFIIATPFIFSGICVCLVLTKVPRNISKLYAADLIGAALGCIVVIFAIKISDGPTAVFIAALLASLGAMMFKGSPNMRNITLGLGVLLTVFVSVNMFFISQQRPLFYVKWAKGLHEGKSVYEKWNSFSRITILDRGDRPFKTLAIDSGARANMIQFDGNINKVEWMKNDIANLVHFIRPHSKVLVIGVGGGKDILSALVFQQQSVVGVEINKEIIAAVNQTYGDYTGHLDKDPRVRYVNDEARSYIARSKEKFDIIQASFIDTWAATAAGAMVMTESSLYTVEAWKIFFSHLTSQGILTFSRWYFDKMPGEAYRLTALAGAALRQSGIPDPQDHIVLVRKGNKATLLLSKEVFSETDLNDIESATRLLHGRIIQSPRFSLDGIFKEAAAGGNMDLLEPGCPLNIKAPTDDKPFFFYQLRLRDFTDQELQKLGDTKNLRAVAVLVTLLITVAVMSLLCIFVPLILMTDRKILKGSFRFFIFFMSIGLAYMIIEISQMQRLNIFLGHPIYGLTVVLFTLLLSSGMGSYCTEMICGPVLRTALFWCPIILLFVVFIFGISTNYVLHLFSASSNMVRICVSAGMLLPLGFFMGMQFPLGIKAAIIDAHELIPWLWGINGAASVCGSVLAMVLALSFGISVTFFCGSLFYLAAFLMLLQIRRKLGAL